MEGANCMTISRVGESLYETQDQSGVVKHEREALRYRSQNDRRSLSHTQLTQLPSDDHRSQPSGTLLHHDNYTSLPFEEYQSRRDEDSDGGSRRSLTPPRRRELETSKHSDKGGNSGRIKPSTFDGKSHWTEFLVQFEMVADVNGWEGERRAAELAACLRDSAVGVLSLMRREERLHFPSLVRALQERFEPVHLDQMHQATLKTKVRRHGETLACLGAEIKRLVRLAFPEAEDGIFNQLALTSFLDALGDADMEWAVR
jgi:hypothetical protein